MLVEWMAGCPGMRSLNADRILGGPEKLREHQSTYAAEMTDLGIRRGRPKRETKAEHKPAAIYRAEAAQVSTPE